MRKIKKQVLLGIATLSLVGVGIGGYATVQTLHADSANVNSVDQTVAPAKVATADTKVKATATSGTKSNYQVEYQATNGDDDNQATLQKTAYNTNSTAYQKLNYVGQANGQQVKVNGQAATVQGTMGKVYVHWNTGKWSVTTVANTPEVAKNPVKFAKQVDTQLQSKDVTTKQVTHGSMVVYDQPQSGQANYVKWQQNDQLYQVKGQQAKTVMAVAASAKK